MYNSKLRYLVSAFNYLQIIRNVGIYKRPAINTVQKNYLDELKANLFNNRTELRSDEWNQVQQMLINNIKNISSDNIDSIILSTFNEADKLPLAKNYVAYLRTNGLQPNDATLGRLLRVYNAAYHARGGTVKSLTPKEQNEILQICADLRKKHDILDATSCENLIYGLVATMQWLDGQELLEMMKLTSSASLSAYTELIIKAFRMGQMQLGWDLLNDMLVQQKNPKCAIFINYLNEISKDIENFKENLERLLLFLQKHELVITEKVAVQMENIIKRSTTGITIATTKLSRLGKCNNCGNCMRNISISDEDFYKLSDAFLKKVLIRNDIFQKSTPEEVNQFENFLAQSSPYDCVIDGLNVAYATGAKKAPHVFANMLAAVVKYFHKKNKRVLVLGRKHMNSWPKSAMQYIRNNATLFLTTNLTQDDPFLLYAAIKSGPKTDFFSRDLMRSHAYLLGPELKAIFRRWQQEHQYSLITQTSSGEILVKEPVRYLLCAHKISDTWHLPYIEEYSVHPPKTFETYKKWLCIRFQK